MTTPAVIPPAPVYMDCELGWEGREHATHQWVGPVSRHVWHCRGFEPVTPDAKQAECVCSQDVCSQDVCSQDVCLGVPGETTGCTPCLDLDPEHHCLADTEEDTL